MILDKAYAKKLFLGIVGPLVLSGCYMEVHEEAEHGADRHAYDQDSNLFSVAGERTEGLECDAYTDQYERYDSTRTSVNNETYESVTETKWQCIENSKNKWRATCDTAECQQVDVYVHYMLSKDLGNLNLHVEAFDNRYFEGQPVATIRQADFEGKRGAWKETSLYLDPGQFFIRAYLTNRDNLPIPYALGDMELVANQPLGVFGALGSPQQIDVKPPQLGDSDPVKIFLDKLFEKSGSGPETEARLRINFDLAEGVTAPDRRDLIIQLRQSESLETRPFESFSMASESLLVSGREGTAEFVSPSLEEGAYYLFAFIDENGNGLFDDQELSAQLIQGGLAKRISIESDKTKVVDLKLAKVITEP